jgi:hypothetical protein
MVQNETESAELARLRREQAKTRHDEVFGGLTPVERAAYDIKQERICELERHPSKPGSQQGNIRFLS